jgi:exopolysaccharide biosynthesis polyprenyl glycosylphosphotransferase
VLGEGPVHLMDASRVVVDSVGRALSAQASTQRGQIRGWFEVHRTVVRAAGRALLFWAASFVVFAATQQAIVRPVVLAAFAALVWSMLCQTTYGAARIKRVAFGPTLTTAIGVAAGFVVLLTVALAEPWLGLRPVTLGAAAGLAFCVVATWERLIDRMLMSPFRLLVVGANPSGIELLEAVTASQKSRFEVVGVVDDQCEADEIAGFPMHGKVADLADVVRSERPELVVLAVRQARPEVFAQLLEVAEQNFSVLGLPEFYEQAFGRLPVRVLTPAWFMSVLHFYQRPYSRVMKRSFDLVLATFGLVVFAPLFLLIGLLVRLTPGPVIYRQTRLGEAGQLFTIYKFRSMAIDAEADGHAWAAVNDPRVTKVGRFLRTTRLDELPQLWNVVEGNMSIVGPRPERPEYQDLLKDAVPFWTSRLLLKPGITGWAQVSNGYVSDFEGTESKLSYDLWYLRHRSFAIDLLICGKTISKLVSGSSGGR